MKYTIKNKLRILGCPLIVIISLPVNVFAGVEPSVDGLSIKDGIVVGLLLTIMFFCYRIFKTK